MTYPIFKAENASKLYAIKCDKKGLNNLKSMLMLFDPKFYDL